MTVLAGGAGLFLLVWAAHVLVWRVRVPRAGRRTLFLVFLGALPFGVAAAASFAPGAAAEIALGSALYLALALAYLALYVALEGDSPTLAVTGLLAAAGPAGLAREELQRAVGLERHLRSRLDLMVVDGMAAREGDRYVIAAKGRRLLGYYDLYGRLVGAEGKAT